MAKTVCSHCGSGQIIPHVKVFDQGQHSSGQLSAGVATSPQAWLAKGWVMGEIYADVCGDCGHMEFFIEKPENLYAAYLETVRNS